MLIPLLLLVAGSAPAAGLIPDSTLVDLGELAEIEPLLTDLSCDQFDDFAYEALPTLVVAGRADLVYELVLAWEEDCGTTEPVDRFRILAAIWDRGFDEGLYGAEIVERLESWLAVAEDTGRGGRRRAFDDFCIEFADQLVPHAPDDSLERFFGLFYSGRTDEAWALLDSEALADTWLRFYRDDELDRMDLGAARIIVAVTTGAWRPDDELSFVGDHNLVGGFVEQRRDGRFVRLACDVRLGRTDRPYRVVQDEINDRSDRFDAVYLGLEGGLTVLGRDRLDLDVFAALGFDGIRPFREEDIMLGTINVGLGFGVRAQPLRDRPWVLSADLRTEFLGERNEGVDPMSGSATSLRIGLGWMFDQGRTNRAARLGR